ncbi:MAG: Sir2 family NAD-dependent protein deacetylase [Chloroflexi bacterium]|nr:Sir2 family NAD-dependent protein deacetylase [Chloroflexota bacterium]
MTRTELEERVEEAALLVSESEYVVALCGAGVSVESGVPTFRGPDGLWTRLGQPSTNSYREFLDDPKSWWEQYLSRSADPARAEFRDAIERAEPNAGHAALVELERAGVLQHTITQNVDDLHRRAGSRKLTEIHGNRTLVRCIGCEARWPREQIAVEEYPPTCAQCGGMVKADSVMFGEPIPHGALETSLLEIERCDCILLVGTSATVMPSAGFPRKVAERGGCVIEINTEETGMTEQADVVLRASAGEAMRMLARRVLESTRPSTGSGRTGFGSS